MRMIKKTNDVYDPDLLRTKFASPKKHRTSTGLSFCPLA